MADNLPDELVITLRKPVKLGDVEYTELKLREPTAGEIEKASNVANPMGSNILLVSLVAAMPKPAVEKIGARDLKTASDYLQGFLAGGQAIGE
jgi:Phage tail assembly chaperone proteins, E, or 41 or 14